MNVKALKRYRIFVLTSSDIAPIPKEMYDYKTHA